MSEDLSPIRWFADPISQSVSSVFDGINTAVESLDPFRRYRDSHIKSLNENLNVLKLLGMASPKRLTDVYWPVAVSTSINSRLYRDYWIKFQHAYDAVESAASPHIEDGCRFVDTHNRVIVLGGPGTGKTTFLKYLALAYANADIFISSGLRLSRFPIHIHLPDLIRAGSATVMDYIGSEFEKRTDKYSREYIRRIMKKGLATILLDSLDEVPTEKRQAALGLVQDLYTTFPENKYVVSCRTADYHGGLDTFNDVELAALPQEAVARIVKVWFSGEVGKSDALLRKLAEEPDIRTIARNPLLLSMICVQYRHDLALPRRKTELFRRCSDALIREWDTSRNFRRASVYDNISDDKKERIFESVAGLGFLDNGHVSYIFRENSVVERIASLAGRLDFRAEDASGILFEIERHHGILVRFSADSYAFSHPSFQEYFAARHFVSTREELHVLRKYCYDEHWRNVIEYVTAIMADPDPLFQELIKRSSLDEIKNYPAMSRRMDLLHLIYRCLIMGASVSEAQRDETIRHIIESLYHIMKIYADSNIFPFAYVQSDGVYTFYMYRERKRQTLGDALISLRKFANEIFVNPNEHYARRALSHARICADEMREGAGGSAIGMYQKMAVLTWLMLPISKVYQQEIRAIVEEVSSAKMTRHLNYYIDRSFEFLGVRAIGS